MVHKVQAVGVDNLARSLSTLFSLTACKIRLRESVSSSKIKNSLQMSLFLTIAPLLNRVEIFQLNRREQYKRILGKDNSAKCGDYT